MHAQIVSRKAASTTAESKIAWIYETWVNSSALLAGRERADPLLHGLVIHTVHVHACRHSERGSVSKRHVTLSSCMTYTTPNVRSLSKHVQQHYPSTFAPLGPSMYTSRVTVRGLRLNIQGPILSSVTIVRVPPNDVLEDSRRLPSL
jgi:hypothetical protein